MPNVRKMVNLLGTSKPFRLKDSDGDRVPNILDCKPYNPKEQGIFHTIGKVGGAIARGTVEKDEGREKERKELTEIRESARLAEARKVAAERGRAIARRPSAPVRFAKAYTRTISYAQRSGRPAAPVRTVKRRKKKRTTTTRPATQQRPGVYTPIRIF